MKRKRPKIWQMAAGITFVIGFPSTVFSVAILFTSFIYQQFNLALPAFVAQLITSMVGLFFCFFIAFILSRFFDQERKFYKPIIETLGKIAAGDFKARLDDNYLEAHGMLGDLTKSVNNMALELNKMEAMRQEFISNVSHEIQSPLTSIRGFAQALHNEQLTTAERNHYLEIIEIESTRVSRISENLLKLASLEGDHVKFEPKCYRLDKQVRDLIIACEPQWTAKELEMDVALPEVEITADQDLLSQVWVNLIHNSLKFTPPGGKICVALQPQPGKVEFRIEDSGVGISEEEQAHVFERFYKADKSRTQSNGGSGLGLSIAHKIVELHQGSISVASTPGVRTTFSVCLPLQA